MTPFIQFLLTERSLARSIAIILGMNLTLISHLLFLITKKMIKARLSTIVLLHNIFLSGFQESTINSGFQLGLILLQTFHRTASRAMMAHQFYYAMIWLILWWTYQAYFFHSPIQLLGEKEKSEGGNVLDNGYSSQLCTVLGKHEKQWVLQFLNISYFYVLGIPSRQAQLLLYIYSWAALCMISLSWKCYTYIK